MPDPLESILYAVFNARWPWWVGGVAIGLTVPLLYYFANTALGVSTGYGNLAKILLRPRGLKWFQSEKFSDPWGWRLFFILGMILGGALSSLLAGEYGLTLSMGQLTERAGWLFPIDMLFFFTGGLLLGLGARVAGGCTSGHSIHGIANLHRSSLYVTLVFLLFAALSANLLRTVFLGGGGW